MKERRVSTTGRNKVLRETTPRLKEELALSLSALCAQSPDPLAMLTHSLRLYAALCSHRTREALDFVQRWGVCALPLSEAKSQSLQQDWSTLLSHLIKIDSLWSPLIEWSIENTEPLIKLCQRLSTLPLTRPAERNDHSVLRDHLEALASTYELLLSALALSANDLQLKREAEIQGGHFSRVLGDLRRSSGAHYTPSALCREVIETAVRPLESELSSQSPIKQFETLSDLKLCDPAMGGGAFVIEAILWIAEQLEGCSELDQHERLVHAARNVYGVDIDPFAVAITQFRVRELTLGVFDPCRQLRCGDSLIGEGFQKGESRSLRGSPQAESRGSVPPISWGDAFPEIQHRGGFDLMIGNPPFLGGRQCAAVLGQSYTTRLHHLYPGSKKSADLCAFFVRRCAELSRPRGMIG